MTLDGAVPHSRAVEVGELNVREELEKLCEELAAPVAVK
jgi:hypothetical protein